MIRTVIAAMVFSVMPFVPAAAQPAVTEPVIQRVEAEGYAVTDVHRTWLGRIVITAENGRFLREIVLSRTSGEILRDKLFALPKEEETEQVLPSSGDDETETPRPAPPPPPAGGPAGGPPGGGGGGGRP